MENVAIIVWMIYWVDVWWACEWVCMLLILFYLIIMMWIQCLDSYLILTYEGWDTVDAGLGIENEWSYDVLNHLNINTK